MQYGPNPLVAGLQTHWQEGLTTLSVGFIEPSYMWLLVFLQVVEALAGGTLPVILSLIPLALTGSFYLRRDESEARLRLAAIGLSEAQFGSKSG